MSTGTKVRDHVRWRCLQIRRACRARAFDFIGRWRPLVHARDHHGNSYLVSTRDRDIGRSVYVNGEFEASKIVNILAVLDARGIQVSRVLDIGANIGTTTIELLTRLPLATAECFEPEPFNHRLLARNISANHLTARATLHQIALSDTDAALAFEISDDNPGDHRVRVTDASGAFGEASRRTIEVPARRLDDLDITMDEQTVACIDVQGHELQVLAGATQLVGPVIVEFWPYALDRAGTLDALIAHLLCMGDVIDITYAAQSLDAAALVALATNRDPHYIRELLVLPVATGTCS